MELVKPPRAYQRETIVSPWVTLVANGYATPSGKEEYHCVRQADYVTIIGMTADGRIPLIRQYRPAVNEITLELPSGLLEAAEGHDPGMAARRELEEEAGFRVASELFPLGAFYPDTGRLENRLLGYFAPQIAPIEGWSPEPNTERRLVTGGELRQLITTGEFKHALNIAVINLAMLKGHLSI